MAYLDDVKKAIKHLHGCEAEHIESIDVLETFEGKTVWEGTVELFALQGHSKAKRCYAWGHRHGKDDKEMRYVAVLELAPVDSARKAVQAAIVGEFRQNNKH